MAPGGIVSCKCIFLICFVTSRSDLSDPGAEMK